MNSLWTRVWMRPDNGACRSIPAMVHHLRSWRWHGATALGAVLVSAWVLDLHGGAGGVLVGLTIGLLLLAHGGGHAQDSAPAKRLPQGSSTGQAPS